MKIAVIGAGNMGGAIAHALAKGTAVRTDDVYVSNPSWGKLQALQSSHPELHVMDSNIEASKEADIGKTLVNRERYQLYEPEKQSDSGLRCCRN